MFKLNQNSTGTIVLTLTEQETLTSPYYLFELTNNFSNKQELFNAADISTATSRYNMFTISLTGETNENVTGGTIYIPSTLNGYWKYKVYEASAATLLASATTSTLEIGKCLVIGTATTIVDEYFYTSTGQTGNNEFFYK